MRFEPGLLDQIRARVPISDVVGRRVTWDKRKSQPARGDYWACCPFHKEKSPSFHCDDRRGIYHCFGCGATGDQFKFMTETEGLNFPEAVERLAEQAGIPLPKVDPREREREAVRVDLGGACEIAAKFFEQKLRAPEGKAARDYMIKRGILEKTSIEFRFGYAPDERGRVVAFGGRTLDPAKTGNGQPKYLNSPETPIFHKGTMLFNVHRAREAAHKSGTMIVTEGYLDAIAVSQAGIRNVVAALGTAFTEDHIARLWRFAAEPVICFDGDKAGLAAAHRAVDRILPQLKAGYSFNFCFLPDGQDPDDIIRTGGSVAFMGAIANAVPLIDVLWERETASANLDTPERKAALEKRIHDLTRTIADPRVSERYAKTIRLKLMDVFWRADARLRASGATGPRKSQAPSTDRYLKSEASGSAPRLLGIQQVVVGLCVQNPMLFELNIDTLKRLHFIDRFVAFLDDLDRIYHARDGIGTDDFYREVRPEFYEVMAEVHAGSLEAVERGGMNGAALRCRLPILNFHPPEVFVEAIFEAMVEKLSLLALSIDIDVEMRLIDGGPDDSHISYIFELQREFKRRTEELERREQELAEEAKAIRAATTGQRIMAPLIAA